MKTKIILLTLIVIFSSITNNLFAQGKTYDGPDDSAGDIAAIREGYMTGNRIYLYFKNTTELSDWPRVDVSRWPDTYNGVKMLDGIGLLVAAKVYVENDSIPVTDKAAIQSNPNLDTLHFLQTNYRERVDYNPEGTLQWGIYPVFGYFNENNEYPAMSNRPESWPPAGWPSTGDEIKWPGEWNGRFGRGVKYADLETYFVANDAQDLEYLGEDDQIKYYPRPNVKIGDKKSDVTVQYGEPWGGVGIRISQRGFQWNNSQAQDAIFWEYTIANISDYDVTEMAFGYWVDNAIGGDASDELGYFDKFLNLSYSWDIDGIGTGGFKTGTMGFAYLESPGLAYDGIDNDDDGLLDEKRDYPRPGDPPIQKIGPTEGIHDLDQLLYAYNLSLEDLKEHWDADEDQDWMDGEDANKNGTYEENENFGDDVGLDGVGPGELNYNGPDEGECNHQPDYIEGVGCEPNYNVLDVTESDMLGLTRFSLFPIDHGSTKWFEFDGPMFDLMSEQLLEEYIANISNLVEIFASGTFPVYQGREERISMAEIHSYDPLNGLNDEDHRAPALFEKKRIVQVIYETDYRFAQPPKQPTLKATPGDGKVILTWDNAADLYTREPFLKNINDFEGYKLYRSSDKKFQDVVQITDGYGDFSAKKPIFQCDIKDRRTGFTDYGIVNGLTYFLGDDTGIRHFYVDENVENGRTYYYGLAAYDYGIPDTTINVAPSENNIVIDLDEAEEIRFIGRNVQIVTPHQQAAGYAPPEIEYPEEIDVQGSGTVIPSVFDYSLVKSDHTYEITFKVDTAGHRQHSVKYQHFTDLLYLNKGFSVYDITADSLVYWEDKNKFPFDNIAYTSLLGRNYWIINPSKDLVTEVFDGIQLKIYLGIAEAQFDSISTGWVQGSSPMNVIVTQDASRYFPWQYDIVFTSEDSAYRTQLNRVKRVKTVDGTTLQTDDVLLSENYNFYVINRNFRDSTGAFIKLDMFVHDVNQNQVFDRAEDVILVGPAVPDPGSDYIYWAATLFSIDFHNLADENEMPQPNDVYRINFNRPFIESDTIRFKIKPEVAVDTQKLESEMDKILVVPNPYVATNMMEPALSNPMLNQRRRLLFTHIPAACTIKIFTSSGVFVDKIDVDNPTSEGIVHWDMLTHENLEIAAGIYVYHVKSMKTGKEKIGKFAVIK
ncbi:hypothetical protein H8E88_17375 [candidate division KSB1 bacterium]|nr:hypothetical protein [candidate division KSB1 bacterium]